MGEQPEAAPTINNVSESRRGRGRPFPKGNRLGGRTPGSRNRTTLAAQSLLDDEGLKLTRKAVELALGGDTTALRLCLERLLPPTRERRITLDTMPEIMSHAADIPAATGSLIRAVTAGVVTPSEAHVIGEVLEIHRKAIETANLEARVEALEKRSDDGAADA
jgi:hypothetical protein